MPAGSAEGSPGCGRDAGDAGEDGSGPVSAGGPEQRVHGDDQVAAVCDDTAAGERASDQNSGTQRRPRESRPDSDGDRSEAATGDGGFAGRDGAAEKGALRL